MPRRSSNLQTVLADMLRMFAVGEFFLIVLRDPNTAHVAMILLGHGDLLKFEVDPTPLVIVLAYASAQLLTYIAALLFGPHMVLRIAFMGVMFVTLFVSSHCVPVSRNKFYEPR